MMKRKSSAQTSSRVATKVVVVMNAGAGCSNHPGGTIIPNYGGEILTEYRIKT
jgi:aspartate carbamoyltransferase catalytic subunit